MSSRLSQMQAKFHQKQIQEREEKLLRLYEHQQQKAIERVNRGSAGSNTSLGSTGGGKVRQMFDERRQKAGIDKSYPLEPLMGSKTNRSVKGASVEKVKNLNNKTIIKSTVQKNVYHIQNGQPIVDKQEVMQSVFNSDGRNESYEERRAEVDNLDKTYNKSYSELVEMMSNHDLDDALDNEEMPQLGELEEFRFTGKLANVGGKLPSEAAAAVVEKNTTKANRNPLPLGKTFRKESKPIIKKSVKATLTTRNSTPSASVHSQASRTATPLSSPNRSMSQTMQTNSAKKTVSQSAQSAKAPCNSRPSAKQSPRSPVARDDLNECRYCNRRFATDRLEVHESICGKTAKKKRKTYDATKHRVEGTELEQYVRRGKNVSSKASKQTAKKDWRKTHEEFINAIRAAKVAQAHVAKGGKLSDLPPPPPSSNPDYVQCPHCGRKFNEAAAERHIPKCANYVFNKPKGGAPAKGKNSGKNMR